MLPDFRIKGAHQRFFQFKFSKIVLGETAASHTCRGGGNFLIPTPNSTIPGLIEKAGEVVFDAQCIPTNAALLDVPNYKTFLRKRREFIGQRLNEFLGTSRLTESPITQFIGATFLFIYRSTIQQPINYSRTLERINSVGMAMQILDTMPDATTPEDLKSKTKASLVQLLVQQVRVTGSGDSLPEIKQKA